MSLLVDFGMVLGLGAGQGLGKNVLKYTGKYEASKFKGPGLFSTIWKPGAEHIAEVQKAAAFRAFQGDVTADVSRRVSRIYKRHGFRKAAESIPRAFQSSAVRLGGAEFSNPWTTGKFAGSLVSRVAFAGLNAYWTADIVQSLISGSFSSLIELGKIQSTSVRPFYESQQAYTMRQAGLMAIHQAQLSTRSAFGREATYMHR